MRKEIKQSLETVFEMEMLAQKKQKRRSLTPIFVALGAICIAFLLFANELLPTNFSQQADRVEEHSIFAMKNAYIGKSTTSSDIAQYVIPDAPITSYALQTTQFPYGTTVYLSEEIAVEDKIKYAFYMFALVQNCDYVTFDMNGSQWRTERQFIEKSAEVSFQAVEDEATLLTAYYRYLKDVLDIPQIQTVAQHMYKLFFNFRVAGEPRKVTLPNAPHYIFYLDEQQYFLWLVEDAAYYVASDNVLHVMKVVGEPFIEVKDYLNE